ncbi:MAG: FMN-binding protein [Acidimicrobiales bacterium]
MRRAGIATVATLAGLVGVLSFHTRPASLVLGGPVGTSAPVASSTSPPTSPPASASGAGPPSSTSSSHSSSQAATATRSATGEAVNFNYGVLSVEATVSGRKLTNVTIASIDDGGNFRSQSIDQQSIPMLEQQALAAQGANIQGVSGASYTSAGFERSLQSALSQLGFA